MNLSYCNICKIASSNHHYNMIYVWYRYWYSISSTACSTYTTILKLRKLTNLISQTRIAAQFVHAMASFVIFDFVDEDRYQD